MNRSTTSRRAVLVGAGALGIAAGLAACAEGGTPPNEAEAVDWEPPTQVPLDELEGAHVITDIEGVAPAYESWPKEAVRSVTEVPGGGGGLRTLAPTWSTAPPAVDSNEWAQQVQSEWNVSWDAQVAADWAQVGPTVLASGDLPDLMWIEFTANPSVLQAVNQGAFADLSPYLRGDAVTDFPNIAKLPRYAWDASQIANRMYIIPSTISRVNQFSVWREDWLEELGFDAGDPSTVEEFTEICREVASSRPGGSDAYPFTILDRGVGFAHEMYGAPTGWREGGGEFTSAFETDEYVEALNWAATAWKDGFFHPDALSLTGAKERELFAAGRTFTAMPSLDLFFGNGVTGMRGSLRKIDGKARAVPFKVPGATDAGPNFLGSSPGFWGGAAIPAKHQEDEEKMRELLSILNYWAAPFGTEEFLLMRFGQEGRHFEFNADGQPEPSTDPAVLAELNMNVMTQPPYQYYPAAPETALDAQTIIAERAEVLQPDPSWGLASEVAQAKSEVLDNIIKDGTREVVTGTAPVSSWEDVISEWKSAGGDEVRADLEELFAQNQ